MRENQNTAVSGIMMVVLLISILALTFNILPAESLSGGPPPMQWVKIYGGANTDICNSLVQTSDGGYALTGITNSFGTGDYDFWLVKTDTAGDIEWNKTYGGPFNDLAYGLVQTSDGGYALVGYTYSYGVGTPTYGNFWLVKTDSLGVTEWNQTYGGAFDDRAYSLVQTSDGKYVLAGSTYNFNGGWSLDFWLIKADSFGNMEWSQTYGGAGEEVPSSLVQTSDGGYALAGYSGDWMNGWADLWLVKTNSTGIMEWNRKYGGARNERANSLVQASDGGYAMSGLTSSYGAGNLDLWLIKTDMSGNALWSRTWGSGANENGGFMTQTRDGGYALTGSSVFPGLWLFKYDSAGNLEWVQQYPADVPPTWIIQTRDGGFAISSGSCSGNFILVKLGSPWISVYIDVKPASWPNPINIKSNGVLPIAICGTVDFDVTTIDVATIKLTRQGVEVSVSPIRLDYEDVATPWTGEYGGGHDLGGDGYLDLSLKFSTQDVVNTLGLEAYLGQRLPLVLTGNLLDAFGGTFFKGQDYVWILELNIDSDDLVVTLLEENKIAYRK